MFSTPTFNEGQDARKIKKLPDFKKTKKKVERGLTESSNNQKTLQIQQTSSPKNCDYRAESFSMVRNEEKKVSDIIEIVIIRMFFWDLTQVRDWNWSKDSNWLHF